MIRSFKDEEWKDLQLDELVFTKKTFRISNYGRISVLEGDKYILAKSTPTNGYELLPVYQYRNMKRSGRYIHKLVAAHFLEKEDDDAYVVHINYDKTDKRAENLKWVTKRGKEKHQFANPIYIGRVYKKAGAKLTEGRVRLIKKKIFDPNRKTRMKMIAKQFGISEMQLYRIKTGENWGEVTID